MNTPVPLFDRIKKTFTQTSGILLLYIVLSFFVGALIGSFSVGLFHGNLSLINILSYIGSGAVTILVFLIAKTLLRISFREEDFQFKCTHKTFLGAVACTLGINCLGSVVLNVFSNWLHLLFGYQISMTSIPFDTSIMGILILTIYMVIVGPIFEELLFRGVILRALDRYNRVFAIVVSSLLFSSLHMNIEQGFVSFFLACFLAYISLKTNSLLIPIALHMINNLLGLVSVYSMPMGLIIVLIMFVCMVYMLFMLYKHYREISNLIAMEHCDYRYGRLFLTRWTTIVYIICFVIFAI